MHNVVTFLNYIADHWSTILLYLSGAGILPAAVILSEKLILRVIRLFNDTEKKLTPIEKSFLAYAWAVIIALAHYVLYIKTKNPWIVLGQGAVLYVASQPFYIKLYKPLRAAILIRVQETQKQHKDASAALIPPEGLPISQPETTFQQ